MDQVTSRKEKRKAARHEKKQHKHQALLQHQKSRRLRQNSDIVTTRMVSLRNNTVKEREIFNSESDGGEDKWQQKSVGGYDSHSKNQRMKNLRNVDFEEKDGFFRESDGDDMLAEPTIPHKMSRKDRQKVGGKKTKFQEFLEMETKMGVSVEQDLKMERKLAKKLKVKNGKLKDDGDELNFLFDGISSIFDSSEQKYYKDSDSETKKVESADKENKRKRKKKRKHIEHDDGSDYDDFRDRPAKEGALFEVDDDEDANTLEKNCDAEHFGSTENQTCKTKRKRIKSQEETGYGDVVCNERQANNLSCESGEKDETNTSIAKGGVAPNGVQGSSKYVAPHLRSCSGDKLQEHSHIQRRVRGLLNRLSESNVESIAGEISSIFQSVSRAVASQIITEEVLCSCSQGPRGNEQYAAVFASFVAGIACLVGIDFGATLMASLAKSFEDEFLKEDNLSLRNLSLLLSYLCIFGVCSSDLIYDFLIKLSKRLTEIDVSTILTVLQCCGMKLRGDDPAAMKNFILSVQSRVNELKAVNGDVEKEHGKRMEFMLETICDIKNNKKRVKEDSSEHTRIKKWLQKLRVEDITLRGIRWSKLIDPDKKGQWWFSGNLFSAPEDVNKIAGEIDKEVNEAQKMLRLAAKLRMNTDTRRAIFCVIMSGEDYLDAFEKLLALNLQGKQDREIMRVLVECCLQEKVFNKYYTALASKLCSHDKNQKFTLQYCLWDQFKELESMPLMRSMHLAKFVAEMIANFTLSLAVLKVVDLVDPVQLTAKRTMHFRMLFEAVLELPDNVVWNTFTRVAVAPELEELRNGMEFFIREHVVSANKAADNKFKLAKKALSNLEGVLM